jgi:hypothetical protein
MTAPMVECEGLVHIYKSEGLEARGASEWASGCWVR